ncbi:MULTISPECIES: amino acid ABC transporter permease [unclassified Pseudofrankia]|uniref:amino acid ABC transporter permease n=1 Tax=unclassified Pseudofrankia TaxID=2994372 RepID=UPI0009F6EA6A|nr:MULTISPECIES: amino acid ABC transporter permease [unclassified Pseudofrankia]MDT3441133.1 amino acid ABC transporter permease [Pseudofrankia sp. BMG5.37]
MALSADKAPGGEPGAQAPGSPAAPVTGAAGAGASTADVIKAVPVRHPGRWVGVAVLALLAAMLVHALVTNEAFHWDIVWKYLFSEQILRGLWATLFLTLYAMAIGVVGGVLLAILRLSPNPVLRSASWLYTWFFRGTPVMIQILFWASIGALYPRLSIGVPFGPEFASAESNTLIPLLGAAVLGLGLNEAAYMAEIVRAGVGAVDTGQAEASQALGMNQAQTMRRIVLPQAMRVIIPPTGNETISMLKTTSLVSVIAYTELLYAAQIIYSRNFQTIPLLMVAAIWYLAVTSVLSVGQYFLERHYDPAGRNRVGPSRPMRRDQSGVVT